jgi:ubiquinone/menaquinone biosynthesis C-methylase UbiE
MKEKNISVFKEDILANSGYIYTNTNRLSCKLSVKHYNKALVYLLGSIKGQSIIDIGCGDGAFVRELSAMGATSILGVDLNEAAIQLAKKNSAEAKNVSFEVMDIYTLPLDQRYDIAILRGVLHHVYYIEKAIERVCKITDRLIVLEPNGYNFILKLLEKFSSYHRRHEEKSYRSKQLDTWFIKQGATINKSLYIGLVPMFCPDLLAKLLNYLAPCVECIPILRRFVCGGYLQEIRIHRIS